MEKDEQLKDIKDRLRWYKNLIRILEDYKKNEVEAKLAESTNPQIKGVQ